MKEHKFGLAALDTGSRHFEFVEPIEVVETADRGKRFEYRELGVAAPNEGKFAAAFAAAYDSLMDADAEHLSHASRRLKRKLSANVTETLGRAGASRNHWAFRKAGHHNRIGIRLGEGG